MSECLHCKSPFDLANLRNNSRRALCNGKNRDIGQCLKEIYGGGEIDYRDSYLCVKCFRLIEQYLNCLKKTSNILNDLSLRRRTEVCTTYDDQEKSVDIELPKLSPVQSRKRSTSSKTGITPTNKSRCFQAISIPSPRRKRSSYSTVSGSEHTTDEPSVTDLFSDYYKSSSSGEMGTLYQLRNAFDRRGVKSVVKDAMNDCRDFIRFTTKGFIVLACMQYLQLEDKDQKFEKPNFESTADRQSYFDSVAYGIIDKYIAFKPQDILNQHGNEHTNPERVSCGYPGCPKSFAVDGTCRRRHMNICLYKNFEDYFQAQQEDLFQENLDAGEDVEHHEEVIKENQDKAEKVQQNKTEIQDHDEAKKVQQLTVSNDSKTKEDDAKFNYTCSVLRGGLMDWCREDAAKENDGERLVRLWRFDLLQFYQHHHTKYSLLAFRLHAQLYALLPQSLAHSLQYNRCVNIHGGEGCNVPGDLALEILNMIAKDSLRTLRGNVSAKTIERCGRSLKGLEGIIDEYSQGLEVYFGKPKNSKPGIQGDVKMMVESLRKEKLFSIVPGRFHRSFPDTKFNALVDLQGLKLSKWLTAKKEEYAKLQRLRSYHM